MASKRVKVGYSIASKIGIKFVSDNPQFNEANSRYERLKAFVDELREKLISYSVQLWRLADDASQLGNCLTDMLLVEDESFKPAVAFRYAQEDGVYGYANHLQEAFMRAVVSQADKWNAEIGELEVFVKQFKEAYHAHSHYSKKVEEMKAKLEQEAQKSSKDAASKDKERLERNEKKLIEVRQEYFEIAQQTCQYLNLAWEQRAGRLNLILGRLILFQESRAVHQLMLAFGTSKILRGTIESEDEEFYGSLGVESYLPKAETKHMEGILVRKGKVINSKGFYRLRGRTLQGFDFISEPSICKRQVILSEPKEEYEVTACSMPADLTIRVQCESGSDVVLFVSSPMEAERWQEAFQAAASWDRTVSHRKVEAKLKRTLEFRENFRALDTRSLEGLEREFGVVDSIRYSQSIPSLSPPLNARAVSTSAVPSYGLGQGTSGVSSVYASTRTFNATQGVGAAGGSVVESPQQHQQPHHSGEAGSHTNKENDRRSNSSGGVNERRRSGGMTPTTGTSNTVTYRSGGGGGGGVSPLGSVTTRGAEGFAGTGRLPSPSAPPEHDQMGGGGREGDSSAYRDVRQETLQRRALQLPEENNSDDQEQHHRVASFGASQQRTPTRLPARLAPPLPRPPLSKSAPPLKSPVASPAVRAAAAAAAVAITPDPSPAAATNAPPPSPSFDGTLSDTIDLAIPLHLRLPSDLQEGKEDQEQDGDDDDDTDVSGEGSVQEGKSAVGSGQVHQGQQLQLYEKRLREQQQQELELEQQREKARRLSLESADRAILSSPSHQRSRTDALNSSGRQGVKVNSASLKRTVSLQTSANTASKVWQKTKLKLGLSKKGSNDVSSPSWQQAAASASHPPSVSSQGSGGGGGAPTNSPVCAGEGDRDWGFDASRAFTGGNPMTITSSTTGSVIGGDSDDDDDDLPLGQGSKDRYMEGGGGGGRVSTGGSATAHAKMRGMDSGVNDVNKGEDYMEEDEEDDVQLEVFRQLCGTAPETVVTESTGANSDGDAGELIDTLKSRPPQLLNFDRLMLWEELQELHKEGVLSVEETRSFMIRAKGAGSGRKRSAAAVSNSPGARSDGSQTDRRAEEEREEEEEEVALDFRSFCRFIGFLEDKQFEQDLLQRWGVKLKAGPSTDV